MQAADVFARYNTTEIEAKAHTLAFLRRAYLAKLGIHETRDGSDHYHQTPDGPRYCGADLATCTPDAAK